MLHMVTYMFQWYSLNLSYPSPLCLHVCSLCLCLYFCPENRFICTIFLDSIYMWYYLIFFSFCFTSLYTTDSRSIHTTTNVPISSLFMAELFHCVLFGIPLCVCTTSFFYLFFNWRIIALQTFVVFCQISTWISHRYIHVPSLLTLRPISASHNSR